MTSSRALRVVPAAIVLVVLVLYPQVLAAAFSQNSARYWTLSIGSQAIILGIVALSLVFMAGHGGMVSLAQATLAGVAAYAVAILAIRMHADWLPAAVIALALATLVGMIFGAIASRTSGIYFLMLTLALAVGFFYLALQNYDLFEGHIGYAGILGPTGVPRADPASFFYICLASALAMYLGLRFLSRSTIGLTFQGIRDNPRRMRALGYRVTLHRVAIFGIGGFVAGVSGVLGVWYRGNISPGIIDLTRTIDVLIIAVVGGLAYPIGAFVGAIFFVLINTFASSLPTIFGFDFRERFNTFIGLGFLLVVLFSPTGLVGLADRTRLAIGRRMQRRPTAGLPGAGASAAPPATTTPASRPPGDPSSAPEAK